MQMLRNTEKKIQATITVKRLCIFLIPFPCLHILFL